MAQDWDIKARSRVCSVTGTPFEDGQTIVTGLQRGEEGFERIDVAESAWTEELKAASVSVWKAVYRAPPPPAAEPLKKETAETLLRQLISREDDARSGVMFILAVMLERKRELVERDVQERDDGTRVRIYEHRRTGEMFAIVDPELKLSELAPVQAEVNELLGISPRPQPAQEAGSVPEPDKDGDEAADEDGD